MRSRLEQRYKEEIIFSLTKRFGYKSPIYKVVGYGYISPEQEQLITLDGYLNELRGDSTFADKFIVTYLNSTVREDEHGKKRVSFDFSSEKRGRR